MGDYYYFPNTDKDDPFEYLPIPGDSVIAAMQKIARREGVTISDDDILRELGFLRNHPRRRSKKKARVSLYIDGTNLFAGLYELFGPKRLIDFTLLLSEINKIFLVDRICFYASYIGQSRIRRRGWRKLASAEAIFYHQVRKCHNLYFYKGHRSPTSGKEKGVDVHLALDMVKDAFLGKFDEAVMMTGDADLIYPLEIVRQLHLPVHAVFFPNRFSLEIAYKASSATVLNYRGIFKGVGRKLPSNLRVITIKKPRL